MASSTLAAKITSAPCRSDLKSRLESLFNYIKNTKKLAIAYSGGVDSTMLLAACARSDPESVLAVTFDSVLMPSGHTTHAKETARLLGVRHIAVTGNPLKNPYIRNNHSDRCYHCKKELCRSCANAAADLGFTTLADGRIADDDVKNRPGTAAAIKLGVVSPLAVAGFTKADVRYVLREVFDLPGWDRPAGPCLATRFPTGTGLTECGIAQVRMLEDFIHGLDFRIVRARVSGNAAIIETSVLEMAAMAAPDILARVVEAGRQAGFADVTVSRTPYGDGGK